MPKARKTIEVEWIRAKVNSYLAQENSHITADHRRGLAHLLETVLLETNNYAGFNYLGWLQGGYDQWVKDGRPQDNEKYLGDQTRRYYYGKDSAIDGLAKEQIYPDSLEFMAGRKS